MMWKKAITTGLIAVTVATSAWAQADKPEFELTFDYMGKYIWRGQNLSDDPAFQPGMSTSYKGITAGIWGSMETTDINTHKGDFTEVDYYLDYTASVPGMEKLSYSAGVIYYDFPATNTQDTTELYWGLSLDAPLNPSITMYHDVDEPSGIYASFAIGHSMEKVAEISPEMPIGMDISVSTGWGDSDYNEYYWGPKEDAMNDLTISMGFPVSMGSWTLTPSINYATILDSDLRKSDTYSQSSDYFFAGVGLSTSF